MEILEKLLESGATVDFQDRVSKRAGIGWEVGSAPIDFLGHKQVALGARPHL